MSRGLPQRGFTIPELLVVIIVVAVLSAVTVAAYSGVTKRAVNTQIAAAVNQMHKALLAHREISGKPFTVDSAWFHVSITTMAGVCVGSAWPSLTEVKAANGYPITPDNNNYSVYCGWHGNTSITAGDATEQHMSAIDASPVKSAFPKVPVSDPIEVKSIATDGSIETYRLRGLRYAYNNSSSSPTSYIYYAVYGKKCFESDVTVRTQDTIWASAGGGTWAGTFTTGGDYTSNDTAQCMRTIRY